MDGQATNDFAYHMMALNEAHVFPNANNVRIRNFTANVQMTGSLRPALEVLYQCVAPNAILNKGGRADDAKCHPGTQKEVIGLIEKWMNDPRGEPIFWMSGPSSGGKTAIMKTIAERSADGGVQTINFFFFRSDSTHKSTQPVVATLLYQLLQLYPSSSEVTAKVLSERPRIFDESIDEQCKLISRMFPIIRELAPSKRIILLIDGLDECDVDAECSQPDLLCACERLLMQNDTPFRLLIASRREAGIQMTFNQLQLQARSIFLNEEFSPECDIRLFVDAEFTKIKSSHPLRHSLSKDWPSLSDVQAIIATSSGQFIYATTVMREIAHPYTVPSLSLERVMGVVQVGKNSPFTNLDNIYFFVLNRASNPDVTRIILSVKFLVNISVGCMDLLRWYNSNYDAALIESCVSEISAIARLTGVGDVEFYHASLADFLQDKTRSGGYWINVDAFRAKILASLWRKQKSEAIESKTRLFTLLGTMFYDLQKPTPDITAMLVEEPFCYWMVICTSKVQWMKHYFSAIKALYYLSDIETYKHIVRQAIFTRACFDEPCPHKPSWHKPPCMVFKDLCKLEDIPHAWDYYLYSQRIHQENRQSDFQLLQQLRKAIKWPKGSKLYNSTE